MCLIAGEPSGEAAASRFSIDIRARSSHQVYTRLTSSVKEVLEAKDSLVNKVTFLAFQKSPSDVISNC